jgi:hypothetical protein
VCLIDNLLGSRLRQIRVVWETMGPEYKTIPTRMQTIGVEQFKPVASSLKAPITLRVKDGLLAICKRSHWRLTSQVIAEITGSYGRRP